MPHCVIEYSEDVASEADIAIEELVAAVHAGAYASESIPRIRHQDPRGQLSPPSDGSDARLLRARCRAFARRSHGRAKSGFE